MGDDIRVEFTFAAALEAVALGTQATVGTLVTGKSTLWEITKFELELCIVELSDEGMAMVNEVSPFNEPIYIHSSSYRHFTSTMPTGTGGMYATLVPARFSSLKSITFMPKIKFTYKRCTS